VGGGFYQEGEIRRLRGEYAAAETAYQHANRFGSEPQPGLALLRLAQGRSAAAANAVRRVLDETTEPLRRARLLPACVEILLVTGDLESARAACEELEAIAQRFETQVLAALAARARGTLQVERGDAQGALQPLRRALGIWQQIGAPYVVARIRVELARIYAAVGDRDGAQLEREAARRVFAELGAAPDLANLDAPSTARAEHGLTPRQLEVLRLVARGETNRAVARELCVSVKTIDRHLSNIFNRIGVLRAPRLRRLRTNTG